MDDMFYNNIPPSAVPLHTYNDFPLPLQVTPFNGCSIEETVEFFKRTIFDAILTIDTTNKRYLIEFYQGNTKLGETAYSLPNPPHYHHLALTEELFGEITIPYPTLEAGSETEGANAELKIHAIDIS
jgi:hypothetical protein